MKISFFMTFFFLIFFNQYAVANDCGDFSDKLLRCEKYECFDSGLFQDGPSNIKVIGKEGDKCHYIEYLADDTVIECKLSLGLKLAIVRFIEDIKNETYSDENTYFVDGKEVKAPYKEAFKNGSCVLTGKQKKY